jgi:hypothetical protein
MVSLVQEVVVLVVGLESLQVVSLLGILPLELTTRMGGVLALRRRGGTVHEFSFVVLVLLQVERFGYLMVVTVVVFVEVALVGKMVCVDAKCAPSAKHTASRASWLHTCKESQDVLVNFP